MTGREIVLVVLAFCFGMQVTSVINHVVLMKTMTWKVMSKKYKIEMIVLIVFMLLGPLGIFLFLD